MFKIITSLLVFFREIIFESKEEYDFKSRKFNPIKTMAYIIIVTSLVLNVFLVTRVYYMAVASIATKKKIEEHALEDEKEALLRAKEKISKLIPSDSGNNKIKIPVPVVKEPEFSVDGLTPSEKKALYKHLGSTEAK
jgi:hypothetical protein